MPWVGYLLFALEAALVSFVVVRASVLLTLLMSRQDTEAVA